MISAVGFRFHWSLFVEDLHFETFKFLNVDKSTHLLRNSIISLLEGLVLGGAHELRLKKFCRFSMSYRFRMSSWHCSHCKHTLIPQNLLILYIKHCIPLLNYLLSWLDRYLFWLIIRPLLRFWYQSGLLRESACYLLENLRPRILVIPLTFSFWILSLQSRLGCLPLSRKWSCVWVFGRWLLEREVRHYQLSRHICILAILERGTIVVRVTPSQIGLFHTFDVGIDAGILLLFLVRNVIQCLIVFAIDLLEAPGVTRMMMLVLKIPIHTRTVTLRVPWLLVMIHDMRFSSLLMIILIILPTTQLRWRQLPLRPYYLHFLGPWDTLNGVLEAASNSMVSLAILPLPLHIRSHTLLASKDTLLLQVTSLILINRAGILKVVFRGHRNCSPEGVLVLALKVLLLLLDHSVQKPVNCLFIFWRLFLFLLAWFWILALLFAFCW